jgi:ubiquinone/menaquinone biosynthesis C-methylase UbiE
MHDDARVGRLCATSACRSFKVTLISKSLRDQIKLVLFELGAGYYARKLANGPEADLRREFLESFAFPPVQADNYAPRVLDMGCGPGHLARALARRGYRVTGVDRSWRLLRIAKRLAKREKVPVQFERAPADNTPFTDAAFDLSFATGVIYWVEQPEATLREMVRVTRPGGTVALLDPHTSMSVPRMRAYASERRLNRRDTRKLMAWALAASFNRRFEEVELRRMLTASGLVDLSFERRLGGMVWFSKGVVASRASCPEKPSSSFLLEHEGGEDDVNPRLSPARETA